LASELSLGEETVLVLACADGAGSAEWSHVGSRLACDFLFTLVENDIKTLDKLPEITYETALDWVRRLHDRFEEEAAALQIPPRQLATTILAAIVGESQAAFFQIGDGAIVVQDEGSYRHVFWPQSGEYANSTNFLTDSSFPQSLVFELRPNRIDEIALLTDGLQMLALSFGEKRAHEPFFAPMFQALRAASDANELDAPLRAFLESPRINERTDDDKTLVLATRIHSHDAAI
jgi:hypothetical protein